MTTRHDAPSNPPADIPPTYGSEAAARTEAPLHGRPSPALGSTPTGSSGGASLPSLNDTPTVGATAASSAAGDRELSVAATEVPARACAEGGSFEMRRSDERRPETSTPSDWPEVPGYEIRGRVGGDGMGQVYRALDLQLHHEVALKIPRTIFAKDYERFLQEARAMARLKHPNVVAVHTCGRTPECVYFTMDLIEGPDAGRLIRVLGKAQADRRPAKVALAAAGLDVARLTPELQRASAMPQAYFRIVATWIAEAATGLAAAHEQGLLHYDIKPSNLLLAPDGRMLVADFGLARPAEQSGTGGLGVTGTYPYIAPERAAGDWARVDERADLWALGATLYEFLTFQVAYSRPGRDVLQDIITRDVTPPSELSRRIPQGLERICLRALARNPDERYRSGAEMARDLRAWVARPPTTWRRRAIASAAMILVGAVGMLGAWHWITEVGQQRPDLDPPPPPISIVDEPGADTADNRGPEDATGLDTVVVQPADLGPPAGAPEESQDRPSMYVPSWPPTILLAFSEDLNVADERPPRVGGTADRLFREYLFGNPADSPAMLIDQAELPDAWDVDTALSMGRSLGAAVVIYASVRAEHVGTTPAVQGLREQGAEWRVGMDVRLIRVSDEATRVIVDERRSQVLSQGGEYRGAAVSEMVARNLERVRSELDTLLSSIQEPGSASDRHAETAHNHVVAAGGRADPPAPKQSNPAEQASAPEPSPAPQPLTAPDVSRPPSPVPASTPIHSEFSTRYLKWRFVGVQRSGPRILLRFELTPVRDFTLTLHGNVSRLYDDQGREYRCTSTTLVNRSSGTNLAHVRATLTQGVTVQAEYVFDAVPADVARLTRAHIAHSDGKFDVRNIEIP